MPSFVTLWSGREPAEIADQGKMSRQTFQRLFLDSYAIEGERHHPQDGAAIAGVLLVLDAATVLTVPIWAWREPDGGSTKFLCQSTEDGQPPAFSIFSSTEGDLVKQIRETLRDPG